MTMISQQLRLIGAGCVVVDKGTSLHRAYLVDFNVGVGGVAE